MSDYRIPHRIAFAWVSNEPMSWLRLQSIQTFARHNPGWAIEVIHARPRGDLPLDTQADLLRWRRLHEHGGWFADTDIVWLRSMRDAGVARLFDNHHAVITTDSGTEGPDGKRFAIGLMGAWAATATTERLVQMAEAAASADDHQSAGTRLLASAWPHLPTQRIVNLPGRLLYPWGHYQAALDNAWDPEIELPDGLLGLHWSGGHASSRAAEQWATAEWARHSRVPVAQALRRAYGA